MMTGYKCKKAIFFTGFSFVLPDGMVKFCVLLFVSKSES